MTDKEKEVNSEFSQDIESNISKITEDMRKVMQQADDNDDSYLDEDVSEDNSGEESIENEVIEEKKISSVEKEARERGWKPKDELKNPDEYISPAEYLKNSKFVDEISKLRKQTKQQEKSLKFMNDILFKNHQISMKERADFFLAQKKNAITMGNVEEAEKFEKLHKDSVDELERVKMPVDESSEDINEVQESKKKPQISQDTRDFIKRNASWFNGDSDDSVAMRSFAIDKEDRIRRANPYLDDAEVLMEVERSVKSVFSHKFENQNRKKPSAVMTPSTTTSKTTQSSGKVKYTINDLPIEARREVKNLARKFNMSADDYAHQLIAGGYLK